MKKTSIQIATMIIIVLVAGTVLMAALKVASVINVSWWLVTSPLWALALMWTLFLGIMVQAIIFAEHRARLWSTKKRKK